MQLPATFGKYELLERIATGGMAEVYLARSIGIAGFEKRLVIKRIRSELAEDPRFVQMFIQEAKLGVHLNHPNIVQVYELGRVDASWYIAMEHLHGHDLTRTQRVLRASDGVLEPAIATRIVAEVCRGLAYAHSREDSDGQPLGLVHRDISPHNIVVTFEGEVKLVDFGIARAMHTETAEATAGLPGGGKYAYMSPEQALGEPVDHRSDLYGAGIVLWELLHGRRLFRHEDHNEKLRLVQNAILPDPTPADPKLPEELLALCHRALARLPEDRFQSADEFEEELRAWLYRAGHRVGRLETAATLRELFPGDHRIGVEDFGLHKLAADVGRLGFHDYTGTPKPDLDATTSETPLPGRLPVAIGEQKQVAVLVLDIDGLTEMSVRLSPEQLFVRRLAILRWIRKIADQTGGVVHRVVDDQVMVLFGVPRTRVDDLSRALECAIELRQTSAQLRRRGLSLRLSMGIHVGEVTVASARRRFRYTERGDTTRLARRLSSLADHDQILLSEQGMRTVKQNFTMRRGPMLPNRGGRPPAETWEVTGRRAGLRGPSRGPWLRRGNELDVLQAAFMRLADAKGSAIALTGVVGSGKSRLVREVRSLARRRNIPFYAARCARYGNRTPMQPLAELVRQILGIEDHTQREDALSAVRRVSQLGLSERDRNGIEVLLGLTKRTSLRGRDIWHAVERLLVNLTHEQPAVFALDNVHVLDEASRVSLERMVRLLHDHPAVVIITSKPPLDPVLEPTCVTVELEPFDAAGQTRLVATLLGARQVDSGLADRIIAVSEGNPLYIEELTKYLIQEDLVRYRGGTAALEDGADVDLPMGLAGLLSARIDALDPAAKGLLQLAAVVGHRFQVDVVAEAAGLETPTPLLLELAANDLIAKTATPNVWMFRTELLREAALRGSLGIQRRDYHRLVASALETLRSNELDDHLVEIANHCAKGGRLIDAVQYIYRAGRAFEDRQALKLALESYRQGLKWLSQADKSPDTYDARVQGDAMLNLRCGMCLILLGQGAIGEQHIQVALDVSSESQLPWIELRAHLELGRSYLQQGRLGMAQAHLEQAQALLRFEDDPDLEREVLESAASLAFESGRNAEAEDLWRQALRLAADNPGARARCRIGLANRHLRSGQFDEAGPLLDTAMRDAKLAKDRILEGRILNNIGLMHSWAGEHEEALSSYRHALKVREGIGYSLGVVVNHHNIGDVHFQRGELAKAHVAFQRSRDLAEDIGWHRGVVLNDVYLAYVDLELGHGTTEQLQRATDAAMEAGDTEVGAAGIWLLGRYYADQGQREQAKATLTAALQKAEQWELLPMIAVIQEALDELGDR